MLNSILNGYWSNSVPGRQFPKAIPIAGITRNAALSADIAVLMVAVIRGLEPQFFLQFLFVCETPPDILANLSSVTRHSQLVSSPSGIVNSSLPINQHLAAALPPICLISIPPNSQHSHATSPQGILTSIPPTTNVAHLPPRHLTSQSTGPPQSRINQDMAAFLLNQIGLPTIKI